MLHGRGVQFFGWDEWPGFDVFAYVEQCVYRMCIKYVVAMGISQKFAAARIRRDFLLLRVSIFDGVIIVTITLDTAISLLWFHFLWALCE